MSIRYDIDPGERQDVSRHDIGSEFLDVSRAAANVENAAFRAAFEQLSMKIAVQEAYRTLLLPYVAMDDLALVKTIRALGHGKPNSNGLELAICKPYHLQQQPTVAKPRDLRFAEGAGLVVNRGLDDLQILLGRAEDQIEVAERIEVAEVGAFP